MAELLCYINMNIEKPSLQQQTPQGPPMNASIRRGQCLMDDSMQTSTTNTIDNVKSSTQTWQGRLKSVVWQHFEKIKIDGKGKVQCKYCIKLLGG